jgi:hypothetical protein
MKSQSFIDPGGAKAPPARAGRGCPGVDGDDNDRTLRDLSLLAAH